MYQIGRSNNITANILGFFQLCSKGYLTELLNFTNNYTPSIFEEVYRLEISKTLEIFGLTEKLDDENATTINKTINIGTLSFPVDYENKDSSNKPIYISAKKFKNHSLITGVTGSGKSRLAGIIINELASIGAHISILDPHDEYLDLLYPYKRNKIFKFSQTIKDDLKKYDKNVSFRLLSFFEQINNANTLSKLLPALSDPQEIEIYEIFNELGSVPFKPQIFINKLIEKLNIELKSDPHSNFEKIRQIQEEAERISKNHTEFIDLFVSKLMSIPGYGRAKKKDVILALIMKINELRKNNLLDKTEPNWLQDSPFTIDIFNIDYSTNEYIRRFVNSIIQHFLRRKSSENLRVLIIDEAHLLLNEDSKTSSLVKQLLREARKFNLSIIFISQNQNDIPVEIRNQFQNTFAFREKNIEETIYFPNQLCLANLFASKSSFAMKVNELISLSDIQNKVNK